jgi:hypothetical protein
MFSKILKLVIITRYTKSYLIAMGLMLIYSILLLSISRSSFDIYYRYIFIALLAFFIIGFGYTGTIPVQKSDMDFLFVSSIKRRDFASVLFISSYLFQGWIFLFISFVVGSEIIVSSPDKIVVILDLFVLSIFITSFVILMTRFSESIKLLLSIITALFFVFALVTPYSPASFMFGHVLIGTIMVVLSTIVVGILASRVLMKADVGMTRVIGSRRSRKSDSTEKNNISFVGRTPERAIIKNNFNFLSFVSKTSGSSLNGRSSKVKYLPIIGIILAVIMAVIIIKEATSRIFNLFFIEIFFAVYASSFIPMFMSQGALSMERGWLSFTAIDPAIYMKNLIIGKVMQALVLLSPSAIIFAGLSVIYKTTLYRISVIELIIIPGILIFMIYLSFFIGIMQIKDPEFMTPNRNLKQFLYGIAIVVFMVPEAISLLIPYFLMGFSVAMVTISLYLLTNKKMWRKLIFRLMENDFL